MTVRDRAKLEEVGHLGHAFDGVSCYGSSTSASCPPLSEQVPFHCEFLSCCRLKSNGTSQPWMELSETVNQNKSFSFKLISSVFCHIALKLTQSFTKRRAQGEKAIPMQCGFMALKLVSAYEDYKKEVNKADDENYVSHCRNEEL